MPRVIVTSPLPADPRAWMAGIDVVGIEALEDAEGMICLLTERIDDALMARAKKLRVIANCAVGVDNVDVAAATRRGIAVCNTPDVLNEATADLTMALLLAVARRVVEGDRLVRSGAWTGWEPGQLLGADVYGRTLGLVGFGRIGRAVARRARGFDMKIVYATRHRVPDEAATWLPIDELCAESDFVSLHCPLNDGTRGIISAARLARMRREAFLINTARGACVDETALADALDAGRIAGAALDVFAEEPRVPERLRASPRVLLAPHIGSATLGARTRMVELCARGVAGVLAGTRPPNVVNPEVLAAS